MQTGRREILISASPQMRQSEGNSTVKRLPAKRPAQECLRAEAIEFPDASPMIWLARIESSLLLKTASFVLARRNPQAGCRVVQVRLRRSPLLSQYNGPEHS
jgi:hypothetical protein